MSEPAPQRLAGWLAAVWLAFLLPTGPSGLACAAVLAGGAVLRAIRARGEAFRPRPAVVRVLLAASVAIPFLPGRLAEAPAAVAVWIASVLLLRPLAGARRQGILLCAIVALANRVLDPGADVSGAFPVFHVAVLMLLAHQMFAPEGSARGIREILLRSLRLVVPVALAVTTGFWFFPSLSSRTHVAFAGFADGLDPGEFSGLRVGRGTAMVAAFEPGLPVPPASALYWRARVLEKNDGLRWSGGPVATSPGARSGRPVTWCQSLLVAPGRPLAPLDFPLTAYGEVVESATAFAAESTNSQPDDPPQPGIASGSLAVPSDVLADPAVCALARELVVPGRETRATLDAMARFLSEAGFEYSAHPGRMRGIGELLTSRRKGFCGHYAAACANLLRIGGVPARVVTGYRGGRWNPWTHTITVRDSDAHAWVEAWDPPAREWIRFDPTDAVAPDLARRIETDREPARWPWHRSVSTFAAGIFSKLQKSAAEAPPSVAWMMASALALGLAVRIFLRGRAARAPLADLEHFARRRRMPRLPGETPLEWIARLRDAAGNGSTRAALDQFADAYDRCLYSPKGESARPDLVASGARLRRSKPE
jgi:transglutaminase-like putative cysteine protease